MASILRAECTTLGFVPLLPFVQQMNPLFLLDFPCKIDVASASEIRFSAFFLGVPCARFLVCPIINNTITKILFSVAFFQCSKENYTKRYKKKYKKIQQDTKSYKKTEERRQTMTALNQSRTSRLHTRETDVHSNKDGEVGICMNTRKVTNTKSWKIREKSTENNITMKSREIGKS